MIDLENPAISFTALDRCDGCGSQAYALAEREDSPSDLLFCRHHVIEHAHALTDEGWRLIYDTAALEDLGVQHHINI